MDLLQKTKLVGILCLLFTITFIVSCEKDKEYDQITAIDGTEEFDDGQKKNNQRGVPSSAHVKFGDENAGSPFPPQEGHDQSIHASDKMVPRTVVIAQGGEVHYQVAPFHQVAIYGPDKKPGDIDLSPGALDDLVLPFPPYIIADFIINDPNGRVDLSDPLTTTESEWTTNEGTFAEPGKYLVICTTFPHFAAADMYGWVIVK